MELITFNEGSHWSTGGPGIGWGPTMTNIQSATVRFHENCRYDIGSDQLDWNKLFGRTTNGVTRYNSMRVGWRYRPDVGEGVMEIGAYTYKKGKRQTEIVIDPRTGENFEVSLGFVQIDELFTVSVAHEKYKYVFNLSYQDYQKELRLPAKKQCDICPSWKHNPYFGGNRKTPHKMTFMLEWHSR